jgi:hypothetical protein
MWSAWWILWALIHQIYVAAGKHQAAISSKYEQLWDQAQGNASHIQIEFKWFLGIGGRYLLLPLQERVTHALFKNVMFFNSGFKSDPLELFPSTCHSRLTMASIESSIVISKFLHCTILVTMSAKSYFQENFNLKWIRIQHGVDLGCCWMLFLL